MAGFELQSFAVTASVHRRPVEVGFDKRSPRELHSRLGRSPFRILRGRREAAASAGRELELTASALRFNEPNGPLVAIAGVCGGAGVTTLAYLTAAAAASASTAPVLLADLGGPSAGVAGFAGIACARSFTALANSVGAGDGPPGAPFVVGEFGLRVLAAEPEIDELFEYQAATDVLAQARAAHGLTIVDCGQMMRRIERVVVEQATHVVWVLPASAAGLRRALAALKVMHKVPTGAEIVAARCDPSGHPPVVGIAALADRHGAPLVLVPQLEDVCDVPIEHVINGAGISLQALGGALCR
jgi:hypothetical protein